jgi:hypothetical protein
MKLPNLKIHIASVSANINLYNIYSIDALDALFH